MLKYALIVVSCLFLVACHPTSHYYKKEWDVPQAALATKLTTGISTKESVRAIMGTPQGERSDVAYVWPQQANLYKYMAECTTMPASDKEGQRIPPASAADYGEIYEIWQFTYRELNHATNCSFIFGCSYEYLQATNWFLFNSKGVLVNFGKQREGGMQVENDPTGSDKTSDYCQFVVDRACKNPNSPTTNSVLQLRCEAQPGVCCS